MNINPLSILFGIIALPEPAISEDDTAPFIPVVVAPEPPVMKFAPIVTAGMVDPRQLCGCLVAYRQTRGDAWQFGNITATEESKYGRISALFTPKEKGLCEKWRDTSELMYVVWE